MRTASAIRGLIPTVTAAVMFASATLALAAEPQPPAAPPAPSKEMREKMATLHERMAACLRSDKPVSECHTEMQKNCRELLGKEGCPMLGRGMGHMGMGQRGCQMMPPAQPAPDTK